MKHYALVTMITFQSFGILIAMEEDSWYNKVLQTTDNPETINERIKNGTLTPFGDLVNSQFTEHELDDVVPKLTAYAAKQNKQFKLLYNNHLNNHYPYIANLIAGFSIASHKKPKNRIYKTKYASDIAAIKAYALLLRADYAKECIKDPQDYK